MVYNVRIELKHKPPLRRQITLLLPSLCAYLFIQTLSGCIQHQPTATTQSSIISDSVTTFTLTDTATPAVFDISISNQSNHPIEFYLTPKAIDFRNYKTLLAGIIKPEMTEEEKAFRLWNFTSKWSNMGIPPSRNREPCDPLKLFNSIQYALCGGINAALANLDSLAGLRSRVYHLSGHVVSEVFYNNSWHMFDADRSIYFLNDKKEVASVEYIADNPEIIEAQKGKIRNWAGMKYSYKMMQRVYSSKKDNSVNEWFKNIIYNYRNVSRLEKDDKIDFSISKITRIGKVKKVLSAHADVTFEHKGILKRRIANANVIQHGNEFLFKEQSPYLIKSVYIKSKNLKLTDMTSISVYYSPDGIRWYFKGSISNSATQVFFNTTNPDNEKYTFSYFLKFVSNTFDTNFEHLSSISIENDFLFSDKIFVNDDNSFKLVFLNKRPDDSLSVNLSEALSR